VGNVEGLAYDSHVFRGTPLKPVSKLLFAALLLSSAGIAQAADRPAAAAAQAKPIPSATTFDKRAGRATGTVIYRGVSLITAAVAGSRESPQANMAIVVQGERIRSIIPAAQLDAEVTSDAEVIDARGLYAMPGLIDSHVHYATWPARALAEAELKRNIYGGLTGVRDMAGDARALADLSRASLINEIPSPDIFYGALVAGPSFFEDPRTLSSSLGLQPGQVPWLQAVTEQTDLRLAVARARGTGATGLKIYANLRGSLVRNLISAAKQQGFPVWTHQQVYPATPLDSLGATSVSHVCMIARFIREPGKASYGHSREPSYAGLSAAEPGVAQYIAAMAQSGTMMDATLSVYQPQRNPDGTPKPSTRCPIALAGEITRAMHAAGIPILAGTDADAGEMNPWPALHDELRALVGYAGLTPYEAIVAATRNAAAALGKSNDFGSLQAGKYANMVLLKQDPTADIGNLESIVMTVKRGQRFTRADYQHKAIPAQADF
jgi:hypothetical protein